MLSAVPHWPGDSTLSCLGRLLAAIGPRDVFVPFLVLNQDEYVIASRSRREPGGASRAYSYFPSCIWTEELPAELNSPFSVIQNDECTRSLHSHPLDSTSRSVLQQIY